MVLLVRLFLNYGGRKEKLAIHGRVSKHLGKECYVVHWYGYGHKAQMKPLCHMACVFISESNIHIYRRGTEVLMPSQGNVIRFLCVQHIQEEL
jgi:sorbitol-specific phosphotransferase system component IIA